MMISKLINNIKQIDNLVYVIFFNPVNMILTAN